MKRDYFEKVEFFLLTIFLPTLVFTVRLNSIILFFLALNWFIYALLIREFKTSINKKYLWLIILFFCLYLLQLFRADDLSRGWFSIEKRLSLLALPVIFCYSISDKKKLKNIFFLSFVVSVFLGTLVSFYKTSSIYFIGIPHLGVVFENIIMHKPHFALYCLASIFILTHYTIVSNKKTVKFLCITVCLHFFIFCVLIIAKMALIAFFITLYFIFLLWLFYHSHQKVFYAFASFFFIPLVFGIFFFPDIKEFVIEGALNKKHPFHEYLVNLYISSSERTIMWQCSVEALKENYNWVIGVGLGNNINSYLNECYLDFSRNSMASIGYNPHNQYLHTWLLCGFSGFILLVVNLLLVPILAIKKQDLLSFALITFFVVCLFTESMFAVQKGVVYFSFFYSMLLYGND